MHLNDDWENAKRGEDKDLDLLNHILVDATVNQRFPSLSIGV